MPSFNSATKRPSRATSYDVAVEAGVAQSTVSRCFQKDSPISPETRTHVLAVAARLNYRPNALARSLIMGRSDVVGVIVTKYTLRYNPDVIFALGEALSAVGAKLLLITVDDDDAVHKTLDNVLDYPLDGLVCCAAVAPADITAFQQHGVPLVFFNRQVIAKGVDCVTTDNSGAAGIVAEALYRAGHRRFLCIGGPANAPVSIARLHGFTQKLHALGAHEARQCHSNFSYEDGSAVLLAEMRRVSGAFDAVFCTNDELALGALDACRFTLGLNVPDDISIVGFDDVPDAARPPYRLTTVKQELLIMATEAVRLLASRLVSPGRRSHRINIPGVLVARQSARLHTE